MDSSSQGLIDIQYTSFEYSIPKVSSDGEPHEVMTMIAAFSGLIAAIIVLIILILLIRCGKSNRISSQQQILNKMQEFPSESPPTIIPIFNNDATLSKNHSYENPVCEEASEIKEELILKAISLPGIQTIKC